MSQSTSQEVNTQEVNTQEVIVQQTITSQRNAFASEWQKSIPPVAWGTLVLFVAYCVGYYFVVSNTLNGNMSYGLGSIICSYLAYVGFTIVHDAGHGSIFKLGSSFKPIEAVLGWVASLPLLLVPYPMFKCLHNRHHAFTNDPDRDPDHFSFGDKWYQVLLNCLFIPVQYHLLTWGKLKHIPVVRKTYLSTVVYFSIVIGLLATLVVYGYLVELIFLLFIPNVIAVFVLALFFDYLPHHPHKSVDRYHDSRVYPSKLLNVLLLGQNYHLAHHMYPRAPWYKYKEVFERIKPDLVANNAPIENPFSRHDVFGFLNSPNANNLLANNTQVNMRLRVKSIDKLTSDAVVVEFNLPSGQVLKYLAGQYITVSKWLKGETQTRCYSLCRPSGKDSLVVAVKKQPTGLMSEYLNNELAVGDELIVKGPFGDFVYPPKHKMPIDKLVLVAGGSGITPLISIIKSALTQPKPVSIHLIYASHADAQTMFLTELQWLKQQFNKLFDITYAIKHADFGVGRLNRQKMLELLSREKSTKNNQNTEFYVCGPARLNEQVIEVLGDLCIDKDRINIEEFTFKGSEPVGKQHNVDIEMSDGLRMHLEVASNQTILDVANQRHVSIPSACGKGTCGTCKFKVVKGSTTPIPDEIPGISREEKALGYTLACQCKPTESLILSEVT